MFAATCDRFAQLLLLKFLTVANRPAARVVSWDSTGPTCFASLFRCVSAGGRGLPRFEALIGGFSEAEAGGNPWNCALFTLHFVRIDLS